MRKHRYTDHMQYPKDTIRDLESLDLENLKCLSPQNQKPKIGDAGDNGRILHTEMKEKGIELLP